MDESKRQDIAGLFSTRMAASRPFVRKDDDWSRPQTHQAGKCAGPYVPQSSYDGSAAVETVRDIDPGRAFYLPEWVHSSPDYNSEVKEGAPYGTFDGRPIIGGESPVAGGVYLAHASEEAIVVDEDTGSLAPLYTEFTFKLAAANETSETLASNIGRHVINFVTAKMHYAGDSLRPITMARELGLEKVLYLDAFVTSRAGAARHQVLLAAYLFEKLIARGLASGKIFIDNGSPTQTEMEKLVFIGTDGSRYIFEPWAEGQKPVEFITNPFLE